MDPAGAVDVACAAARTVGLDSRGAQLFRLAASVQVEFPHAGALARIEAGTSFSYAQRMVQVASFYASRNAPTVRLAGSAEIQPVVLTGGRAVTFWERLEPIFDARPSPEELGRLALALHDVSGPPFGLEVPRLDPLAEILQCPGPPLTRAMELRLQPVFREAKNLAARWPELLAEDPLGVCVVHGDLHEENVLRTRAGLVLVDLENAGVGPSSWDLAAQAVAVRRYGAPADDFDRLLLAYGKDPRGWAGFADLCRLYEVMVGVWTAHCGSVSGKIAAEAEIRVASLLGESNAMWTLV